MHLVTTVCSSKLFVDLSHRPIYTKPNHSIQSYDGNIIRPAWGSLSSHSWTFICILTYC